MADEFLTSWRGVADVAGAMHRQPALDPDVTLADYAAATADVPEPVGRTLRAVSERGFTGELHLALGTGVRVHCDGGHPYIAERVGDAPLGSRLVSTGVLSVEQLERGMVRVGDVEHLGRIFDRERTIDRDAVVAAVELLTDELLTEIAGLDAVVSITPYRHHRSGVHRWFVGPGRTTAPRTTDDTSELRRPMFDRLPDLPTPGASSSTPREGDFVIEWDEPVLDDTAATATSATTADPTDGALDDIDIAAELEGFDADHADWAGQGTLGDLPAPTIWPQPLASPTAAFAAPDVAAPTPSDDPASEAASSAPFPAPSDDTGSSSEGPTVDELAALVAAADAASAHDTALLAEADDIAAREEALGADVDETSTFDASTISDDDRALIAASDAMSAPDDPTVAAADAMTAVDLPTMQEAVPTAELAPAEDHDPQVDIWSATGGSVSLTGERPEVAREPDIDQFTIVWPDGSEEATGDLDPAPQPRPLGEMPAPAVLADAPDAPTELAPPAAAASADLTPIAETTAPAPSPVPPAAEPAAASFTMPEVPALAFDRFPAPDAEVPDDVADAVRRALAAIERASVDPETPARLKSATLDLPDFEMPKLLDRSLVDHGSDNANTGLAATAPHQATADRPPASEVVDAIADVAPAVAESHPDVTPVADVAPESTALDQPVAAASPFAPPTAATSAEAMYAAMAEASEAGAAADDVAGVDDEVRPEPGQASVVFVDESDDDDHERAGALRRLIGSLRRSR